MIVLEINTSTFADKSDINADLESGRLPSPFNDDLEKIFKFDQTAADLINNGGPPLGLIGFDPRSSHKRGKQLQHSQDER